MRHVTHGRNCLQRRPKFKADDFEATTSPKPERARGQEHGRKAGRSRRRVWYGPATPARYGESCIARTPMSSGGSSHSSVARLESDAIASHGIEFRLWYALRDGRCLAKALKGMSGAPTSRSYVPPERNMGSPTGRETHGDGVLVVPNREGRNSLTQTDGKVCRWLVDHRTGDPVRGRAGEGEQVAR